MGGIGLRSATFPIELPAFPDGFASIKFTPMGSISSSRSPFTSTRQTFTWPGEYWMASVSLPPMYEDMGRAWVAWLALLRSQGAGRFLLRDTSLPTPRGSFAGTPVVNGASQSGQTLAIKGLTAGRSLIARSGDWIQLGDGATDTPARLHQVLLDADADGSGHASLRIFPRLRYSPADNAAIVTVRAKGEFALPLNGDPNYQQGAPAWTVDSAKTYGIAFDAIEAI